MPQPHPRHLLILLQPHLMTTSTQTDNPSSSWTNLLHLGPSRRPCSSPSSVGRPHTTVLSMCPSPTRSSSPLLTGNVTPPRLPGTTSPCLLRVFRPPSPLTHGSSDTPQPVFTSCPQHLPFQMHRLAPFPGMPATLSLILVPPPMSSYQIKGPYSTTPSPSRHHLNLPPT